MHEIRQKRLYDDFCKEHNADIEGVSAELYVLSYTKDHIYTQNFKSM